MQKFCYAAELKDDQKLIAEYEHWHRKENSWPEVNESITAAGITRMEIFRTGNRLFMIIEADESFDPRRKEKMDAENPFVQRWESLMWQYQQPLSWAAEGEKWVRMDKIFDLKRQQTSTDMG